MFRLYRLLVSAATVVVAAGLLTAAWVVAETGGPMRRSSPQTIFIVTTNEDINDGSCDAHCSLREALIAANTIPGPDEILFSLPPTSHTITLTALLPNIEEALTIDGSGVVSLTISGNHLWRVFTILDPAVQVTLSHLNIVNGLSYSGGGIFSRGFLTLQHISLKGNNASYRGGAVENENGALRILESTFSQNSAEHGGAISVYRGTIEIDGTHFEANQASNLGGVILNVGFMVDDNPMSVSNTSFISNTAAYGGALFVDSSGHLTITHSHFSQNAAAVYGGGILNGTQAVVRNSTFFSNTAGDSGGGIHNVYSLALDGGVFGRNAAGQYGGGIANFGTNFYSATITVSHTLFQENMAGYGGAMANWTGQQVAISNSTLSANQAITWGGGILNSQSIHLNNVTLAENEAATGGGIVNSGLLAMSNSMVANSVGGDCENSGVLLQNLNNLVADGHCDPLLSGDPLLAPLADNGGNTWTYALLPGSPALDAGDDKSCEQTDQRGVIRPLDGDGDGAAVCDIGAVEQEFTLTPTPTPTSTLLPPPPTPTATSPTSTPAFTPAPTHTFTPIPTQTPVTTPAYWLYLPVVKRP